MIYQVFLVTGLFLSTALSTPIYNPQINTENKSEAPLVTSVKAEPLDSNNLENKSEEALPVASTEAEPVELDKPVEQSSTGSIEKDSDDLTAQETYYPIGGVWWGFRPWGGWGGYRPGWHGWHRPHWGGHWGGNWGGNWGGPWGGSSLGRNS